MIRKKLNALTRLSAILILAVLAATSLIGAYIATSVITTSQTIQIHKELSINEIMPTAKVVVQIQHKDGTTETIEKEGDPWTWNLVAIIGNIFLGRYYAGSPLTIYKTDGGAVSFIEDCLYSGTTSTYTNPVFPLVAIGIGSGSTAPSRYDVELINPITKIDVSSAGVTVTDDGTTITATYSASYTASSDLTVRETAFYMKAIFIQTVLTNSGYGSLPPSYVMLARDVLQSPVSLVSGDVITVTYQISMNYANPPMTKNLAYLIYNYIFGLAYYNMPKTFIDYSGNARSFIDLGQDSQYNGMWDSVKESAGIAFGTGAPQYQPAKANIGQVASVEPVTVSIQLVNSTHAKISWSGGTSFTSTVTVTEVGFYFYTDVGASTADTANAQTGIQAKVLLLYFPLESSLSVPAGAGVRFSFDLYIQLAPSS